MPGPSVPGIVPVGRSYASLCSNHVADTRHDRSPAASAWVKLPYVVPSCPPPTVSRLPIMSCGRLVMMLTTPLVAPAPHTALPGPRTASMRSTSLGSSETDGSTMIALKS